MSLPIITRIRAFMNSDILVKALVEKDGKAITRLREAESILKVDVGEKFLISDFVYNDVLTKANDKGISNREIINRLYPGKTIYYQISSVEQDMANGAKILILQNPDFKLTLTDWTALMIMGYDGITDIISDKEELDMVVNDLLVEDQVDGIFRNIRRI
jgi:hypothetical protein